MRTNISISILFSLLFAVIVFESSLGSETETPDRLFKAGKWEQARAAYESVLADLKGNDAARVLRQIGYTW